jgi:hypothetical protein
MVLAASDYDNQIKSGFEIMASVELAMSYGGGALANWGSPAPWMGKPKKHLPTCEVEAYDDRMHGFGSTDFRGNMVARQLSRAKMEGKLVYLKR